MFNFGCERSHALFPWMINEFCGRGLPTGWTPTPFTQRRPAKGGVGRAAQSTVQRFRASSGSGSSVQPAASLVRTHTPRSRCPGEGTVRLC